MDQPSQTQSGATAASGVSQHVSAEGELGAQLTRIEEKVGMVEALQTSKRRRVWFFSLSILCCAIWFIWSILQPVREIYRDPSTFLHAVEQEETTTFLPILKYEFNQQLPKLYAALDQAFQAEWVKRSARFPTVRDEMNLMLGQINNYLSREGVVRVSLLLDRYQKRLEADFPEIAHDEDALENIGKGLEDALTTVIGARLHKPFESLSKLRDDFLALPVPEDLKKLSDAQLQEVMLDRINAYLNVQFHPIMELVQGVRQQLAAFENHFLDMMQHLEGDLPGATKAAQTGKE